MCGCVHGDPAMSRQMNPAENRKCQSSSRYWYIPREGESIDRESISELGTPGLKSDLQWMRIESKASLEWENWNCCYDFSSNSNSSGKSESELTDRVGS